MISRDSKVCPGCEKEKAIGQFTSDRSRPDGRETYCRACKKERNDARFIRDHDKILARAREYNQRPEVKKRKQEYEKLPEVRKRRRQQDKQPERRQRNWELDQRPEAKQKQKEYDRRRNQLPELKESHKQQVIRYALEHPEWKLVQNAKQRARKKGVIFDLKPEDIVIPEFCPILGLALKAGSTREQIDRSPSIDEIVPGVGYVPENTAVISHRANTIKNDGTEDEHRKIADWMDKKLSGFFEPATTRRATTKKEKRVVTSAKQRAKAKELPFDLCLEEVEFPDQCPVFGVFLEGGTRQNHENSPSLDRIDSGKGYTRDNVAIICHRANFVKSDGTADEHRRIADWISQATSQEHEKAA